MALVIGNSKYRTVSPLKNPRNDAVLMRDSLQRAGFKVTMVRDANCQRMRKAIIDFGAALNKGAVGLFYYSGHGIQLDGANYMVPVDANLQKRDYASVEAVNLNDVLTRMGPAGNRLNIVVLDACRNNPFPSFKKAASRGLAVTQAPGGTYIAYATGPGSVADDGDGRNSPFTLALAKTIGEPGLLLDSVFNKVRSRVMTATSNAQTPWSSSSVTGDFYFKPGKALAGGTTGADAVVWSMIKDVKDPGAFKNFLRQYPNSKHAAEARSRYQASSNNNGDTNTAVLTTPTTPTGKSKVDPAVGLHFKPGSTFRDCEGCPEMVVIPPGSFMMGSPSNEKGRQRNEGPQHRVKIEYKFAVGKFEVTQAEWRQVMGNNPSRIKGDRNPVEEVSWNDPQADLKKLSQLAGKNYRLLSETEWEYVARSGTTTPFHTGNQITTNRANFNGEYTYNGSATGQYRQTTISVGSFHANQFGVHDMHGNVMEWVSDCWNDNYQGAPNNGSAWTEGDCSKRVLRSGNWSNIPVYLRSAFRYGLAKTEPVRILGFRVARTFSR